MKKAAIEAIKIELGSDETLLMNYSIDKKILVIIEPMILEIISHFKCKRCGECCRGSPPTVPDEELIEIAKSTGDEVFEALDTNFLMNVFKSPCRFLTDQGCRIYNIKPKVCRFYPLALNQMGMATLYLCPMGKEIQKSIEAFIISKGLKPTYHEGAKVQIMKERMDELYRFVGYGKGETTRQIGVMYWVIPPFLKYLKSNKRG